MIIGYIVIGILLFIYGCFLFDNLISYQYEIHHEEWVNDGKPRGFCFSPRGSSFIAMNIICWKMLKKRPEWLAFDSVAINKHLRLAMFNRCWTWYCILVFPVAIISSNT
jgi:hypothetical protein